MNLKKSISTPFPYTRGFVTETLSVLKVCIIVTLILFFLKPFGLERANSSVFLGFGLVVFLSAIFNTTISLYVVRGFINEEKWCVWKEIIRVLAYLSINILAIIFFASAKFDFYFNMLIILKFIGFTVLFAIIPISMRVVSTNNWLLKNKLKEVQELSNIAEKKEIKDDITPIELKSNIVNDVIHTNTRDLQFIEAEQNYIIVTEQKENKNPESKLLRLSMIKALEQIEDNNIVRCHRSFIVNLRAVTGIKGNSQGVKLVFSEELKPVPVSRSFKENVKNRLSKML